MSIAQEWVISLSCITCLCMQLTQEFHFENDTGMLILALYFILGLFVV